MKVLFSKHYTQLSSNAPKKKKKKKGNQEKVHRNLIPSFLDAGTLGSWSHDLLPGPAELLVKGGHEKRAGNKGLLYVHLVKIRCPRHVSEYQSTSPCPILLSRFLQNLIQQPHNLRISSTD
jgi:hypothetical protein